MSSKLTIHDILDLAKRAEQVYVVRYWVERYFAMPAQIIGWREISNDHCLEIKVKFEIDGIEAFFYPEEIYSDAHDCQIEADAKQKKYGRVSILQAEYDELLEIKKKYEELIGGTEDLGAEPYELQETLEFWHSKTVPLWQIPDQKRDEDFVSTTIELWGREIKFDCDSGLPKLCFAYIPPSIISWEAALFEVELFDVGRSSKDALWVIELKEPVNRHDYPDDFYIVEASLYGEVFANELFYFSNPSRLISKNTHTRRKKNE